MNYNDPTPAIVPTNPAVSVSSAPSADVDEMGAIGPVITRRKAEEWRFVLRAIGVGSWIDHDTQGRYLLIVPKDQLARSVLELTEYEQENRQRIRERTRKDVPLYRGSWWAAGIVLAISVFFAITGPSVSRSIWFRVGVADTNAILRGAVHETITALTLHSTMQHLVGNVLIGGVFFALVHKRFGAGLGSLLIVGSGALGNFLNALWHWQNHRSIGASTAVMGAFGILAAAQFVFNRARIPTRKTIKMWAPLMAGTALLGMFGSSPDSDLLAHAFGFLAGVLLGLVAAYPLRYRQTALPLWMQVVFGVTALGIVVGAWLVALTIGPVTGS